MNDRDMPKADFVTAIILMIFGGGAAVMAMRMPRLEHLNINPYTVPGIVPGLLGSIIAFMGLILFVRAIRRNGYRLGVGREEAEAFLKKDSTRRSLLTLAACLIYSSILLGRVPYLAATILFVFAFIAIFEYSEAKRRNKLLRTLITDAVIAVSTGAIIAGVFQYLFLVKLP